MLARADEYGNSAYRPVYKEYRRSAVLICVHGSVRGRARPCRVENGFRCDGIAMSIYNTIAVASVGICTGIFNLILSKSGYAAPYTNAAGQLIAVQSESVKSAITFTFVGLETITGIVLAILLLFLNVEKNIAKEQEEIKQRNGETTE